MKFKMMSKRTKIVLIALAVVLVAEIVIGICAAGAIKGIMNDPSSAFDLDVDHEITGLNGEKLILNKGKLNILLLGLDSNEQRVKLQLGKRTDMIMLCTIDMNTFDVTLTSVPRDSYAHIYKRDRTTGEVVSDYYAKINTAFAAGGYKNGFGYENAMKCISELLSCDGKLKVKIDYYFAIDMDGIPKICDALGGVEVTLDCDMYYLKSNSHFSDRPIGKKGEKVTLKGDAANTFVRARKDISGGDFARVRHQQQFIMAIGQKVKNMGALSAAPKIFNEVIEFADTNLQLDQVTALAGVLNKMDMKKIQFSTLEGKAGHKDSSWIYIIDKDDTFKKMSELLYDNKE